MVVPFVSAILLDRNVGYLSAADMRFGGVVNFDPKRKSNRQRGVTGTKRSHFPALVPSQRIMRSPIQVM